MQKRIDIGDVEPTAYTAMYGLEDYLNNVELDTGLKELIKIRASQINGCAYCIQLHTEQARKQGESEQRLYALSAWRESPLFNEQERIVLAVTEEVTCIAEEGLSQKTYEQALTTLGKRSLAQSLIQISAINAWNRIAVATQLRHEVTSSSDQ